ncbi:MAG: HupE/UreJ family protein [Bythopirellula sp.]
MSLLRKALFIVLWANWLAAASNAHKPSDSYLTIAGGGDRLTAEWDIALKDLELLVGLDDNQDGKITWGELKAKRQIIAAHALSRLQIAVDGQRCAVDVTDLLVTQHSDGTYAVLVLQVDGPGNAEVLGIQYGLLFDADPTHRGLVLYTNDTVSSTHVLSPAEPNLELRTSEGNLWHAFVDYVREGVWHIWIGFDHILFLIALLLPAVFVWREHQWQPAEAFGPTCVSVLKIVTMFTLAHSITLWLAVMEYVTLPSQLVEATIAFSIILTCVHNLYPVLPLSNWAIAFVFGLVHGFGFANVLLDLGLSNFALALSLLGFNVGVELGQLAIVLCFLPLAFLLRVTWFYRLPVFRFGSVFIAVIAGVWMYERVFNAEILGF